MANSLKHPIFSNINFKIMKLNTVNGVLIRKPGGEIGTIDLNLKPDQLRDEKNNGYLENVIRKKLPPDYTGRVEVLKDPVNMTAVFQFFPLEKRSIWDKIMN